MTTTSNLKDTDVSATLMLVVHRLDEVSKKFDKMEEKLERQYARRADFETRHENYVKELARIEADFKKEIEGIHADQRWVIRGVLAAGGTFLVAVIMGVVRGGLVQ